MPHTLVKPEDVASCGEIEGCSVGAVEVETGDVWFIVGRGVDQRLDVNVEKAGVGMLRALK